MLQLKGLLAALGGASTTARSTPAQLRERGQYVIR